MSFFKSKHKKEEITTDIFAVKYVRSVRRILSSFRRDGMSSARVELKKEEYLEVFQHLDEINAILKDSDWEIRVTDPDLAENEIRFKALKNF